MDGNVHFGRPTLVRAAAQPITDLDFPPLSATWVTYLRNNLLHKKPVVYYRQSAQ